MKYSPWCLSRPPDPTDTQISTAEDNLSCPTPDPDQSLFSSTGKVQKQSKNLKKKEKGVSHNLDKFSLFFTSKEKKKLLLEERGSVDCVVCGKSLIK